MEIVDGYMAADPICWYMVPSCAAPGSLRHSLVLKFLPAHCRGHTSVQQLCDRAQPGSSSTERGQSQQELPIAACAEHLCLCSQSRGEARPGWLGWTLWHAWRSVAPPADSSAPSLRWRRSPADI